MHYTHHFHIIRRRKHTLPISLFVLSLITVLIIVFGFSQVNSYEFLTGFLLSLWRVLSAYLISLVIAVVVSILVTAKKGVEDIALPILDVLQSFPAFSILPLLMAFFGASDLVAIIILTIEMIWPILFSLLTGLKSQNPETLEAAVIFGATGIKKLLFVTLPITLPAIVTGSIVAWGEAWETVLAAEIIIKIPGIGTYLSKAGENNDSHISVIGILLLLAVLFIINKIFWIPMLNKSTKYQL